MLAPKPPQPVASRRAVAAAVVSHQQQATIAPGHVIEIPAPAAASSSPGVPTTPPRLPEAGDATPT
jgi:hypothetical protein